MSHNGTMSMSVSVGTRILRQAKEKGVKARLLTKWTDTAGRRSKKDSFVGRALVSSWESQIDGHVNGWMDERCDGVILSKLPEVWEPREVR